MRVNIKDIINIYDKDISRSVKNKRKLMMFDKNKIMNIVKIKEILESDSYQECTYNIFSISDPKYRIVMSLNIQDKIINHYVTKFILYPKLERFLDIRNIATRPKMGCDYGIKLLKKYLELNKKYDNVYVLKLDIKKYFYSINHCVLLSMLKNILDEDEYLMIDKIINSTNMSYVNEEIVKIKERLVKRDINRIKEIKSIPLYEYGKGLPLGNLSSQLLSIFYLSGLDHFIIHNLGFKYMIRYMDDYCIISHDKKALYSLLNILESKLSNEYKLELNKEKSFVVNVKDGFTFLGYRFRIIDKKTVIDITSKNIRNVRKNVRKMKYLYDNKYISYENLFCSYSCYYNGYKYGNNKIIKGIIDDCWNNEIDIKVF